MKSQIFNKLVIVTALTFLNGSWPISLAMAAPVSSQKFDVEVIVKVSQKGFSDQQGKLFSRKNMLEIPKDKVVRITFVFDEKVSTLAYGDTHQIAITGADGRTQESEKIWMFSQHSSITFSSEKNGDLYRAYCIIDCLGMEHLNNLLVKVV